MCLCVLLLVLWLHSVRCTLSRIVFVRTISPRGRTLPVSLSFLEALRSTCFRLSMNTGFRFGACTVLVMAIPAEQHCNRCHSRTGEKRGEQRLRAFMYALMYHAHKELSVHSKASVNQSGSWGGADLRQTLKIFDGTLQREQFSLHCRRLLLVLGIDSDLVGPLLHFLPSCQG